MDKPEILPDKSRFSAKVDPNGLGFPVDASNHVATNLVALIEKHGGLDALEREPIVVSRPGNSTLIISGGEPVWVPPGSKPHPKPFTVWVSATLGETVANERELWSAWENGLLSGLFEVDPTDDERTGWKTGRWKVDNFTDLRSKSTSEWIVECDSDTLLRLARDLDRLVLDGEFLTIYVAEGNNNLKNRLDPKGGVGDEDDDTTNSGWALADSLNPELSAMEGEIAYAMIRHRRREQKLRKAKITQVKESTGHLKCEVPGCGFDFYEVYGDIGEGFAHVHHRQALGDRSVPSRTSLSDLAIVCANCHAMIHRGGEVRSLESLVHRK